MGAHPDQALKVTEGRDEATPTGPAYVHESVEMEVFGLGKRPLEGSIGGCVVPPGNEGAKRSRFAAEAANGSGEDLPSLAMPEPCSAGGGLGSTHPFEEPEGGQGLEEAAAGLGSADDAHGNKPAGAGEGGYCETPCVGQLGGMHGPYIQPSCGAGIFSAEGRLHASGPPPSTGVRVAGAAKGATPFFLSSAYIGETPVHGSVGNTPGTGASWRGGGAECKSEGRGSGGNSSGRDAGAR